MYDKYDLRRLLFMFENVPNYIKDIVNKASENNVSKKFELE